MVVLVLLLCSMASHLEVGSGRSTCFLRLLAHVGTQPVLRQFAGHARFRDWSRMKTSTETPNKHSFSGS